MPIHLDENHMNDPLYRASVADGIIREDGAEWQYHTPTGEPPFWSREALPNEIDGYDPLTGRIIAHSEEERERLDHAAIAKAEARLS